MNFDSDGTFTEDDKGNWHNVSPVNRALPSDAGCWIDGHWGHYGSARLIEIAHNFGYGRDGAMCQEYLYGDVSSLKCEFIVEASEDAEVWMNENVAPDGFSFGWHDGEWFLWSDESWESVE